MKELSARINVEEIYHKKKMNIESDVQCWKSHMKSWKLNKNKNEMLNLSHSKDLWMSTKWKSRDAYNSVFRATRRSKEEMKNRHIRKYLLLCEFSKLFIIRFSPTETKRMRNNKTNETGGRAAFPRRLAMKVIRVSLYRCSSTPPPLMQVVVRLHWDNGVSAEVLVVGPVEPADGHDTEPRSPKSNNFTSLTFGPSLVILFNSNSFYRSTVRVFKGVVSIVCLLLMHQRNLDDDNKTCQTWVI